MLTASGAQGPSGSHAIAVGRVLDLGMAPRALTPAGVRSFVELRPAEYRGW
jgi:hypothetical protein